MKAKHERSNLLTGNDSPTTELQVSVKKIPKHNGVLAPSVPYYGILARVNDGQTL